MSEALDERKKQILKAVIDDYIETAEPVGSRTIAKKYDMGLSSATIRNEMADLEEMGYLTQPHTSAGRVPSDKGYRMYVNELMQTSVRNKDENAIANLVDAQKYLETKIDEFRDMIRVASGLLSQITKYTAVSFVSSISTLTVKAIRIVPIEKNKAIVVVVMSNDAVKSRMVSIDRSVAPDEILTLSSIVSEKFRGLTVENVKNLSINNLVLMMGEENLKILPIIDGVTCCIKEFDDVEVYHEGEENLFNHPEFEDINKAKTMLEVIHSDAMLKDIFTNENTENGITVKIGAENANMDISDCSVISATYSINDKVIGTIGVLGPRRMDYAKVISALEYIKDKLNKEE